jgi:hypothetical protein
MENILMEAQTILRTTPRRWENLTEMVSVDLLKRVPAPGEWSALDCLLHLIEVETFVMPVRVKNILAGQDFTTFNPESQSKQDRSQLSPAQIAAQFSSLRRESLKLFDRLTPADLTRKARHPELGIVSLSELLHQWAGHDLNHTVQAERAMLQPFILGCGPWSSYFKDHIAGDKP